MKRWLGWRLEICRERLVFGWAGTQNWKNWGRGDGAKLTLSSTVMYSALRLRLPMFTLWGLSLRLGLSKSQTTSDCPPPVASL